MALIADERAGSPLNGATILGGLGEFDGGKGRTDHNGAELSSSMSSSIKGGELEDRWCGKKDLGMHKRTEGSPRREVSAFGQGEA